MCFFSARLTDLRDGIVLDECTLRVRILLFFRRKKARLLLVGLYTI